MIFVIARAEIKAGCMDEYIEIAKANIPNVLAEEGCISYTLTRDCASGIPAQGKISENAATFVECWESLEHLKKHLAAPHMAVFRDKVTPLRVSSELKIVENV